MPVLPAVLATIAVSLLMLMLVGQVHVVSCETDSSTSSLVKSPLDVLHSPASSELARKRKVTSNPPTGAKRRTSQTKGKSEPTSISPQERLKNFEDEPLTILFCSACREPISLKKSVIKLHVDSSKHKSYKVKLQNREARQRGIVEALISYDSTSHPKGETLSDNVCVYRVNVVTAFLKAGVPLYKVDSFRDLLEEHAFHLSGGQHLSEPIPFILHQEKSRIKKEIAGKQLSVIFDGTTHVEEALAIVLRFVDDDYEIKQRLACIKLLKKSMTGEELARVLISTLSTTLGVESYTLIAAMRDRASVNNVAMWTLALVYPSILDVGCFSHTIDLVVGKFNTPTVDELWIALFSRSPKARLAWKTFCGRSVPTYSETRWWSRWEVMKSIHDGFGDVEQFIKRPKNWPLQHLTK